MHRNCATAGLLLVGLALLSGCAWRDSKGTTHTLIVGFGWVRNNTATSGIDIQHTRVLGASLGKSGAVAGYLSSHTLAIDPRSQTNVVLSVLSTPLRIEAQAVNP